MMKKALLLVVFLVALTLAGCASGKATENAQPGTSTQSTSAPVIDTKNLLETRCTVCHSLDRVESANFTAEKWASTIERMVGKGAAVSAEEKQALIDYLVATYPAH